MRLLVGAAVMTLAACATSGPESATTTDAPSTSGSVESEATGPPSHGATSSSPPSSPSRQDPAMLVDRADHLSGTYVRRSGDDYQTRSLWAISCDHFECTPWVLVKTSGGPATDRYRVGSFDQLQRGIWWPKPPGAPEVGGCATSVNDVTICATSDGLTRTDDAGLTWDEVADPFDGRLMTDPLVSLATGVDAVAGGGDGATLFPFEQVARLWSPDDATTYRVERQSGARAFASGAIVLSDGRVLTLLANWSDDRRKLSSRHHGLWVSDHDNWASYTPMEPVFSPPLAKPPSGTTSLSALSASVDPDPVIWVQTWDYKVYVSTDDARTFLEIRIR